MERDVVSQNQMVTQLMQIGHGDLNIFADIGLQAAKERPELLAHMISWNTAKGEVRDSKIALPIIALRGEKDLEFYENAVANLCLLDPRSLMKAVLFNSEMTASGHPLQFGAGNMLEEGVNRYLAFREENIGWWHRMVLQHRKSAKNLYKRYHRKPNKMVQDILFDKKRPKGSVFEAVANLKKMSPQEAAGTILEKKIPFTIAVGALGGLKDKSDILLALIERMSGAELINNTNMLKKYGVFENIELKASYDKALVRAKADKKVSSLKAGKAADILSDPDLQISKSVIAKLRDVQETKIDQHSGIEGDWAVLCDASGSMRIAIEKAKEVAAVLARMVKGRVHLTFADDHMIKALDVTGMTLDEIKKDTRNVHSGGATKLSIGLSYILDKGLIVNGIAIITDGGENQLPAFSTVYKQYAIKYGMEPPVYFLHVTGDPDRLSPSLKREGIHFEKHEMDNVDYYSFPNIAATMKTSRFTMFDEIMGIPLLTFDEVFQSTKGGKKAA